MKIFISGVLGLLGSEAARFYLERGHEVIGLDNNMRKRFFGEDGCGLKNMIEHKRYKFIDEDIYNANTFIFAHHPDVIIHAAAQPSHDWAAKDPLLDFKINATSTLKMLEECRRSCPDVIFVYLSTNKVYGDIPNNLELVEKATRYEAYSFDGISEECPVDQCTHSLFGVSKLSADLAVQEYGRYFGMKTVCFRLGCITGKQHAGVPLHGFLSYMVRCKKEGKTYVVQGYKGKQVRDNIHAFDLVTCIDHFVHDPRPGEVYNMGGSRHSNISVLEALERLDMKWEYNPTPRVGDHQWYISDVRKFAGHYPSWSYKYDMEAILEDLLK